MIRYVDGALYIGSYRARDLAERYGTPLYVYDTDHISEAIRRLRNSLSVVGDVDIYYSMKANSNPHIVRYIHDLGVGIETTSAGEVYIAIESGVDPERIMFTSPGVSLSELHYIIENGVRINVNSIGQLKMICGLDTKPEAIGLRINTGIASGHHRYVATGNPHSKFGISLEDADRAFRIAEECGIAVERLHSHIGSGIADVKPYIDNLSILLNLASKHRSVTEIDIGGGFGIKYRDEDPELDIDDLAEAVSKTIESWVARNSRSVRLAVEPGRFIVARSGVLLARVLDVFLRGGRQVAIVESGFNHLIRPVLYGSYHRVVPAENNGSGELLDTDVYGPLCESGDYLALSRKLPKLSVGDLVAVLDVGAYGMVMASTYNSKPLPAEIMVSGDGVRIIRYRQEFRDLLSLIPKPR